MSKIFEEIQKIKLVQQATNLSTSKMQKVLVGKLAGTRRARDRRERQVLPD